MVITASARSIETRSSKSPVSHAVTKRASASAFWASSRSPGGASRRSIAPRARWSALLIAAVVVSSIGSTVVQYLNAGLVDEFFLGVAPTFLGGGLRLFESIDEHSVALAIEPLD